MNNSEIYQDYINTAT